MRGGYEPVGARLVAGVGLLGAGAAGLQHAPQAAAAIALPALGASALLSAAGLHKQRRAEAAERAAQRRDPLTGLPNRAQLRDDLAAFLARPRAGDRRELLILDLVGFKKYNDTFGFACGDALLRRLTRRLLAALDESTRAYRLRGGQFALLARGDTGVLRHLADDALFELGEGFMIRCAAGSVALPDQATGASEALKLADQHVQSRRAELRSRGVDELSMPPAGPAPGAPAPAGPDLGELAVGIGLDLGLAGIELEHLEAAVALRDVGMISLPEGLVHAPGRLTDGDFHFVSCHTLAGERLLRSNFGMDHVAAIVRSSHERWDGGGYPDGLAAEEIPLASRIVFVCGAFHDMTSPRAHRAALTTSQALLELERCAGSQFDPVVVERFVAALNGVPGAPRSAVR